MSRIGRHSHTSPNGGGSNNDRRQPKEPEAWEDLGFPEIPPYYPNRLRNRVILGIVLLVIVVAAVAVGVVLSKNNDGGQAVLVENTTVAGNKTSAPSAPPAMSTKRPSAAPSVPSVVNQFLDSLPAYSTDLAESDADSPQAKALAWLENDPQYNDYELHRLNQRYSLAVLYYSTNGESWNNTDGWLSDDNECTWYQYDGYGPEDDKSCLAGSRLAVLKLVDNDLDGSIPTELELLTDLEYMIVSVLSVSGTIHSEL
jgi:hypothetical protein